MVGGSKLGGYAEEAPPSLIVWCYSRAQIRTGSLVIAPARSLPHPLRPHPPLSYTFFTLLPELTFENEFTTLIQCRGSGRGISRRCFVAPRRSKSSVYAAAAPISTRAPRDPLPTTLPLLQFFSPTQRGAYAVDNVV